MRAGCADMRVASRRLIDCPWWIAIRAGVLLPRVESRFGKRGARAAVPAPPCRPPASRPNAVALSPPATPHGNEKAVCRPRRTRRRRRSRTREDCGRMASAAALRGDRQGAPERSGCQSANAGNAGLLRRARPDGANGAAIRARRLRAGSRRGMQTPRTPRAFRASAPGSRLASPSLAAPEFTMPACRLEPKRCRSASKNRRHGMRGAHGAPKTLKTRANRRTPGGDGGA